MFSDILSSDLSLPTLLLFAVILILSYYLLAKRKESKNLPPGPKGWPIIGNAMFFQRLQKKKQSVHFGIDEARKKYGDIIYFKVLGQGLVFINGYDIIQEALVKQADKTCYRPSWFKQIKAFTEDGKGVIWQDGEKWKATRRFVLQAFRDFGVGKTSLEEKICLEINSATDCLKQTDGEPMEFEGLASRMVLNIIYGIVFNERFEYTDETFKEISKTMHIMFRQPREVVFEEYLPKWLAKTISKENYDYMIARREAIQWVKDHVQKQIEAHEKTFDPDNVRDFVDLYLQTKQSAPDQKVIFNAGNMYRVIMDLFIAGSETTSHTINWAILYMQEYPEVQKKCRAALNQVCGQRAVKWSDRGSLPYIEAVLLEIQRLANITPMAVPHTNDEEMTLCGFTIPRHTVIQANLYSSNTDPRYWDNPMTFNPERFLKNGKVKMNPAFMPFSAGPRICLGESLAKMEMFLIFSNLLQRFSFDREDPNLKHTFETSWDQFTRSPDPFKTRVRVC